MILSADSRPLAIPLDAETIARLDAASAPMRVTLKEHIMRFVWAGLRDVELDSDDYERMFDNVGGENIAITPVSAMGTTGPILVQLPVSIRFLINS